MATLTLAYKFVCVSVMLAEINYCSNKLHLKEPRSTVTEQLVRSEVVFDPKIIGFAGTIKTQDYAYYFPGTGVLQFITRLDEGQQSYGVPAQGKSTREIAEELAQMKTMISSNQALNLATNWLAAIDVDVERLQREKAVAVEQQYFPSKNGMVALPLFYVTWGKGAGLPAVDVMISGIDGELLNLRQEDRSYSKRPVSLIKDMDKLLAIPDEEFLKYSDMERSNLVVRFSAVHYPPLAATNSSLSTPATNSAVSK